MTTDMENEVRTMLARRAGDAHVSDDAWDPIASRLGEPPKSVRRVVAFAGGAVAAALLAVVIFVAQHDHPEVQVGLTGTTEVARDERPPHVWEGEPGQDVGTVIRAYLKNRIGVGVTTANFDFAGDDEVRVTFLSRDVATEVLARKVDDQWLVISAASDLVPIHEATYVPTGDGSMTTAVVAVESNGSLMTAFGFEDWDGPHDAQKGESVPVRRAGEGSIRAVLRTSDGTVGLSEVWPAQDPVVVARDFLAKQIDVADAPISLEDFQRGDTTSGEIPYSIDGGSSGSILMREDVQGHWSVTSITSETLAVHVERLSKGTNIAVAQIDADTVHIELDVFGISLRPGQSLTITRGPPYDGRAIDVHAVARKDGRVVAIFMNPWISPR